MMKRIKVKQINNHIWLLNDNDESTGYLVTGSERGLIIDTMTGYAEGGRRDHGFSSYSCQYPRSS